MEGTGDLAKLCRAGDASIASMGRKRGGTFSALQTSLQIFTLAVCVHVSPCGNVVGGRSGAGSGLTEVGIRRLGMR
jgi:hypothetical protein